MPPTAPTLCHVTWHTGDVERTRAFLKTLFGWEFLPVASDYWVFRPPSGAWIGLTHGDLAGSTGSFLPQIAVADIDETCRRAAALSPDALTERGEIEGVGRYADIRDPDGAVFSVIQFATTAQNATP